MGVLGDAELPTGVEYGKTFAGFQLHGSQLLNDLFGGVPFLRHDATSLVAVQSHIHPGPVLPGPVRDFSKIVAIGKKPLHRLLESVPECMFRLKAK